MNQHGIGALIVEPGASLDYFTGVQWWRSERLTAAIIPVEGDPIVVTPFFERPSVADSLGIPAEIRTWDEDEEPLKLVAGFLSERKVADAPIGFEETKRLISQMGVLEFRILANGADDKEGIAAARQVVDALSPAKPTPHGRS